MQNFMHTIISAIKQWTNDKFKEIMDAIPAVPSKVSAFENDSGYQTASEVTAIVQEQLGVIENGTY